MKKIALIATIFMVMALPFVMPLTTLAAGGQSVIRTFQPSSVDLGGDSYVDFGAQTSNFGTATDMYVNAKGSALQRSYVKFDLSLIPTGSTNVSATLSLNCSAVPSGRTHGVHRVTETWSESTITWGNQPAFNSTATDPITPAVGWVSWTVTADVQAWIQDPATNHGWCVKDSIETETAVRKGTYYTRDYTADTTLRPKLVVTYTAPWDSYNKAYSAVLDTYTGTEDTISMKGTGFADGSYDVTYFDAGAAFVGTDADITVGVDGILTSSLACNTDPLAAAGTWSAKVYDGSTGTTLIAHDTFTVNQDVIPEFPTIFAAIGVAGLCFGIYWWMKRRLVYVKA